ncbi:hypothetical protein ES319_D05G132100v1 [Gossypium barbadense]|uniref:RRM domain-containing protein n=1 Tax=Gossypium barbadense TaxID=3634 RepID=A0A5J5RJR0_GOSBA|nr:hypothetical protein ES319_D05G132100v1 [Gossypium barbadense]
MRPIFCGNFEYDARQSDLERLFRKFGRIERVDMKSGFSWDVMEELLRILFHACDELPLLAFKKSHSNPQWHRHPSFSSGIFSFFIPHDLFPASNSDMFQGRNITDLMAEAAENMEKAHSYSCSSSGCI